MRSIRGLDVQVCTSVAPARKSKRRAIRGPQRHPVTGEFITLRRDWRFVQPSTVSLPLIRMKPYSWRRSRSGSLRDTSFQSDVCAMAIIENLKIQQFRLEIGGAPE